MLIIAATPIGNSLDASIRLIDVIKSADLICAEDTRTTLQLIKRLEIKRDEMRPDCQLVSLHDHNEGEKVEQILNQLKEEKTVLQVSDAGTPMINDPGFKLTQAAIDAGVEVTSLPGPSAPIVALVLSGLPVHKFCYEGFLPPKSGSRVNALHKLEDEERTMIFLESKHRIAKALTDMQTVFGDQRKAAVCRELTKPHEEVLRGTLGDLVQIANQRELKGEMCIVVGGKQLSK
jgi:16S rRNA (cytidine1402-2'-O)-methyltransferase